MAKAEATQATVQEAQPKRSVLGRLFRRSPTKKEDSNTKSSDKKRDRTPSPKSSTDDASSREDVPEMHPEATPPKPRNNQAVVKKESKTETQPSARQAAFAGPSRYRWVDIVSPNKQILARESVYFFIAHALFVFYTGNFGCHSRTSCLSSQQGDE